MNEDNIFEGFKYEFVGTKERAEEVLKILLTFKVLAVDTETTGLDPYTSKMLLLQIATDDFCYILDCTKINPSVWKDILEKKSILKLLQNAKFDYKMLKVHGGIKMRNMFDTMLAELILNAGRTGKFVKLTSLVRKYLGFELDKEVRKNFVNKVTLEFSNKEKEYAARDAIVLHEIYDRQVSLLQRDELIGVAVLEFNTIVPLAEMELTGCAVDKTRWRTFLEVAKTKRDEVEIKVKKALKPVCDQLTIFGECTVNLSSPKQLLEALKKLGIPIEDTNENTLKKERHPVIDWILEWRGWNTILDRYGESLLAMTNPITGRIHPEFIQLGAATGRMSSSNPNAQNIPRYDPKDPNSLDLRSCFIAPPGWKIVCADYSQQELRTLAELSLDKNLMEAYINDEDLHTKTSSFIFGVPKDKVTKAQRQIAKTINFAVSYGASSYRVANELKIEEDEAEKIINNYFAAYPGVKTYLQKSTNFAIQNGYSLTALGRRRYFDIPSTSDMDYKKKVSAVGREAGNARIQGSSADESKQALCIFFDRCAEENIEVQLVFIVHDEIVCYAKEEQASRVAKILEESMIAGFEAFFKRVPMRVDAVVSDSWKH